MSRYDNDESAEPVEIFFDRIQETSSTKATLFVLEEEEYGENREQWIPNSLIQEQTNNMVVVPRWFAEKEGLV